MSTKEKKERAATSTKGPSDLRGLSRSERVAWSNKPRRPRKPGGGVARSGNAGAAPVFTVNDTHDPSFGKTGTPTASSGLGQYKASMPRGRTKVRG